ncbi:MAG TPA: hypothetical protein DEF89_09640 [Desulfosporosinus sp.]|nr:hypothetical protein [Desulfosporosinus sp.]
MMKDIIELRNLSVTYAGKSNPALRNLNLSFQKGSFSLITGLSGCGKSTLAHALCGFIPHGWSGIMGGDVWLDGLNLVTHPLKNWRGSWVWFSRILMPRYAALPFPRKWPSGWKTYRSLLKISN